MDAVKKSLQHELAVTAEVNNPFGYGRQLVQDKTGNRHTAFFFPHDSDAAPWWQGENARLAALSAAAWMAKPHFTDDAEFSRQLDTFAADQLNWILGLNPYDSCMLYGVGHNNVDYLFSTRGNSPTHPAEFPTASPVDFATKTTSISTLATNKPARTTIGAGRNNGCRTIPGICWRFPRKPARRSLSKESSATSAPVGALSARLQGLPFGPVG
jgi:hypothetical protein